MTGQLKNFFDHMAYRWFSHRPFDQMQSKVAVTISMTAGTGAGAATKQIAKQLFWWGIPKTYWINVAVAASRWDDVKPKTKLKIEQKAFKIAKKIRIKADGKHVLAHRGLRQKFIFKMMGNMQKSGLGTPKDAAYWRENGWIK